MQKYQAIAKAQANKKKKKLDAEDIADKKKGTYSAKEEAAEEKK